MLLAQLLLAAVDATMATSEFATGMVRTSVLVVQRRGRLLAAKAVVLADAVAGVCKVAVGATFTASTVVSVLTGGAGLLPPPTPTSYARWTPPPASLAAPSTTSWSWRAPPRCAAGRAPQVDCAQPTTGEVVLLGKDVDDPDIRRGTHPLGGSPYTFCCP